MVKDIILADSDGRELGAILDSNITVDTNGEYEFSVQIARSNWYPELTFQAMCILRRQNMEALSERC